RRRVFPCRLEELDLRAFGITRIDRATPGDARVLRRLGFAGLELVVPQVVPESKINAAGLAIGQVHHNLPDRCAGHFLRSGCSVQEMNAPAAGRSSAGCSRAASNSSFSRLSLSGMSVGW